jgi:hypothetical protein
VIHAQELKYDAELQIFKKTLENENYAVKLLDPKVTVTKLNPNVLMRRTGICNFVIYNKQLFNEPKLLKSKFASVSNPNKGMYIQDVEIPFKSRKKSLRLKAVSAHLDSNKQENRLKEMELGHQTIYERVGNYKELVKAIPDFMLGGGDINTRLQTGDENNPWKLSSLSEETQAYNQCPLGRVHYSKVVTYDKVAYKNLVAINKSESTETTNDRPEENVTQQEGKRKGEQDRGYLDMCWSSTGQEDDVLPKEAHTYAFTGKNQRDHAAVASHVQDFVPHEDDLARVEAHVLKHMKLFDQGQGFSP